MASMKSQTGHNMNYTLPSIDLINQTQSVDRENDETIKQRVSILEQTLKEFGIDATVKNVKSGPVVTRFELELPIGTKSASLMNLSRDIARSLSVSSVRVIDIIEGTTYVGIEISNTKRHTVHLSTVIKSEQFKKCEGIPLILGCDITNQPIVADLTKTPHLLIAGTTGCGKSVLVNSMIMGMLYRFTPDELQLVMIDPKMLELSNYNGIGHLPTPVLTDMSQASIALDVLVKEMDKRYASMCSAGVRNISGYNAKVKSGELKATHMPYIVVVIDEFADLIMVNPDVEHQITRLAQKSRAAGIHMIIATQRPSTDVITGIIKANIPSRIALRVSSKTDSRIIMDQNGAEDLLGNGDMLTLLANQTMANRVHGCFVSDEGIEAVISHCKAQSPVALPQPKAYVDGSEKKTTLVVQVPANRLNTDYLWQTN